MARELNKKYDHNLVEKGKYQFWKDAGYFTADVKSNKPSFSIVIPPPNVTGKLHLGHAWDTTLQDLIIRYKKLMGFDTLYLPGMDHAGIATQAKVEERLRITNNVLRHDLGREKFIEQVWAWKEEYAEVIREQWSKLGLALDYSREQFTLNDNLSAAVQKVFIDLYQKGLIYRGKRIISWDPVQKTALSNIEVLYQEQQGKMYYFKYFLENSTSEYLTIATTRPETMFADQCVVVNPNDERYRQYWNKKVINPANGELIPVLCDDYVDQEFGTGAMKCTPAHDANDFEIALRHNLAMPICMNTDGTMNEMAGKYVNQDRFVARQNLVVALTKQNLVVEIKDHLHQVGFSERSGAIVEPYLSDQWFVKMDYFAKKIIKFQETNNQIKFYPPRFNTTLINWMEKIQDWCISRQLWWGHQIPAWYMKNDPTRIHVGLTPPDNTNNWLQDEDVLDTWFSSALWPMTTLGWTWDETLFQRYFPTSVLVTGYDIIFFWVSRMMFDALEFTNKKPFNDVLIHGLIRDEEGRKMSKSLGNGIDPMDVINDYGADTLRYFLVTNSAPGQDLRYSQEKINGAWNFINKLWNAARYLEMNLSSDFKPLINFDQEIKKLLIKHQENAIDQWILTELTKTINKVKVNMERYEFVLVGKDLYDFVWNKFCSWYIELTKVNLQSDNQTIRTTTMQTLFYVLKQILVMSHPFIPFVTEEIYQKLNLKASIMVEAYPTTNFNYDVEYLNLVTEIIAAIRELRSNYQIKKYQLIEIWLDLGTDKTKINATIIPLINDFIVKMVNSEIKGILKEKDDQQTYVTIPLTNMILEVVANDIIDLTTEQTKITVELKRLEQELIRSKNLLHNQDFLTKASSAKIQIEQEKYAKYLEQYEQVKEKVNDGKTKN
ncbi:valyl-tRNA synthetase [Spiroplasma sp. NBRC 100390]|uniref:valine--tRNA ligase n=1 Tax=unclassified Spiroplasma TaxID=2637901 RepID=UPI000892A1DB|nr:MULTISPECIES: valine--tRNA ligase [unclassified Spiroplasma]AOX43711.1 valyl-tRNA synthetase [Spiroplasma sp. TU-14]APE13181.1 valyl-tRNA synthetase [Spiroplasma sp. NBRC 100390]